MTFDEFITKWNGKFLEVAGTSNALNQCVDLVNGYIRDVLGLPIIEWTNAVDFPTKAGDKYDWVINTPDGVPQKGDIIVWSLNHIAVFITGDTNRFKSFDENFPIGSPCKIVEHNWSSVSGWLHPKNIAENNIISIEKSLFESLVTKSTKYDEYVALGYGSSSDIKIKIELLNSSIKECQDKLSYSTVPPLVPSQSESQLSRKIDDIKAIIFGKGFWWIKLNKIKRLI